MQLNKGDDNDEISSKKKEKIGENRKVFKYRNSQSKKSPIRTCLQRLIRLNDLKSSTIAQSLSIPKLKGRVKWQCKNKLSWKRNTLYRNMNSKKSRYFLSASADWQAWYYFTIESPNGKRLNQVLTWHNNATRRSWSLPYLIWETLQLKITNLKHKNFQQIEYFETIFELI